MAMMRMVNGDDQEEEEEEDDRDDDDEEENGTILTFVEVRMRLQDVDPGLVFELLPSNKFPKAGAVALFI